MKSACKHAILFACVTVSACQMTVAPVAHAAVLTNPGAEVTQEISQALTAMTGFSSVALAAQDLTQSSELVIERKHQKTVKGELIQGRDLELPQRFQLVSQNGQCWLVHQTTKLRTLLKKAQCRVEDKAG
jgi:hypothetical protein